VTAPSKRKVRRGMFEDDRPISASVLDDTPAGRRVLRRHIALGGREGYPLGEWARDIQLAQRRARTLTPKFRQAVLDHLSAAEAQLARVATLRALLDPDCDVEGVSFPQERRKNLSLLIGALWSAGIEFGRAEAYRTSAVQGRSTGGKSRVAALHARDDEILKAYEESRSPEHNRAGKLAKRDFGGQRLSATRIRQIVANKMKPSYY